MTTKLDKFSIEYNIKKRTKGMGKQVKNEKSEE
jgi:hypothetical protein